jgi:hypothetical protein
MEDLKKFTGLPGEVPTPKDFEIVTTISPAITNGEEILEPAKTETKIADSLDGKDEKGGPLKFVLLTGLRVATIREGKGKDVEKSTMEANGDQSKYMSSLMASTVTIDGSPVTMFMLSDLKMKDYTAIQIAFANINF